LTLKMDSNEAQEEEVSEELARGAAELARARAREDAAARTLQLASSELEAATGALWAEEEEEEARAAAERREREVEAKQRQIRALAASQRAAAVARAAAATYEVAAAGAALARMERVLGDAEAEVSRLGRQLEAARQREEWQRGEVALARVAYTHACSFLQQLTDMQGGGGGADSGTCVDHQNGLE
jgi:hypothetical protein